MYKSIPLEPVHMTHELALNVKLHMHIKLNKTIRYWGVLVNCIIPIVYLSKVVISTVTNRNVQCLRTTRIVGGNPKEPHLGSGSKLVLEKN